MPRFIVRVNHEGEIIEQMEDDRSTDDWSAIDINGHGIASGLTVCCAKRDASLKLGLQPQVVCLTSRQGDGQGGGQLGTVCLFERQMKGGERQRTTRKPAPVVALRRIV